MANKNTNMILAVAVIAVCAIAIIGVGYAYTATTENTGNDSSVKYITLTQGNNAVGDYSAKFNKDITYDTTTKVVGTGTDAQVKTTYKLTANQAVTDFPVSTEGNAGVKLGEVTVKVTKTNTTDGFIFSVENSTTMIANGKYYIGINDGTGEVIRAYDITKINYYKAGTDHNASTIKDDATAIGYGSNAVTTLTVSMYFEVTPEPVAEPASKPLENVTFKFTAEAPTAAPTTP